MRPDRNWFTSGPNPMGGFLKLWSRCSACGGSRGLVGRRSTRFDDTVLGYPLPLPALMWRRGGGWLTEESVKGQHVPRPAVLLGTNV